MKLELLNEDCMEVMKRYSDSYFDLAVVDPPYGIGISGQKKKLNGKKSDRKHHEEKDWDNEIPNDKYFIELMRVSRNQIIWGANYFVKHLFEGHKGWIVWDKGQYELTMSDCELAYSSFDTPTRVYNKNRVVLLQEGTIHPTQKPIKLYAWIYHNYAEEGMKILDTHLGSGSNAIAAHYANMGEFVGCEINEDYFDAATNRIKEQTKQLKMF